ncbi:hypothetical protein BDV11DRAFT_200822, partial [Aspergillus similis]
MGFSSSTPIPDYMFLDLFYKMPQSTQSEGFASSSYNGDLDNHSYLTSDPPQTFTPNLSGSQHTL